MNKILGMAVIVILAQACNGNSSTGAAPGQSEHHHHEDSVEEGDKTHANSDPGHLNFISDRDTSCGMPLSAGVTDTLLYSEQVFGFCSAACKQQFAALLAETSGSGSNEPSKRNTNQ